MHRMAAICLGLALVGAGAAMADSPKGNPCLDKSARTPAQRKIDSSLLCELYRAGERPQAIALRKDEEGRVLVDIRTNDVLASKEEALGCGGVVVSASDRHHAVSAYLPLDRLEKLAESPAVRAIRPGSTGTTNAR